MEAHEIKVYWPPREETAGQLLSRTQRMLGSFVDLHPLLARWYRPAMSKVEALAQPVDLNDEARVAQGLLMNGKFDPKGTCVSGFHFSFWNGADEPESISIKLSCGHFSRWIPWNTATMTVSGLPSSHDFKILSFQLVVLRCMIEAWQPLWGRVASFTTREALGVQPGKKPHAGWLTWLADTDFPPHLVEGFGTVAPLLGGSLITLGAKPLSADRPEDLAILQKGQDALITAGVAAPWPA